MDWIFQLQCSICEILIADLREPAVMKSRDLCFHLSSVHFLTGFFFFLTLCVSCATFTPPPPPPPQPRFLLTVTSFSKCLAFLEPSQPTHVYGAPLPRHRHRQPLTSSLMSLTGHYPTSKQITEKFKRRGKEKRLTRALNSGRHAPVLDTEPAQVSLPYTFTSCWVLLRNSTHCCSRTVARLTKGTGTALASHSQLSNQPPNRRHTHTHTHTNSLSHHTHTHTHTHTLSLTTHTHTQTLSLTTHTHTHTHSLTPHTHTHTHTHTLSLSPGL